MLITAWGASLWEQGRGWHCPTTGTCCLGLMERIMLFGCAWAQAHFSPELLWSFNLFLTFRLLKMNYTRRTSLLSHCKKCNNVVLTSLSRATACFLFLLSNFCVNTQRSSFFLTNAWQFVQWMLCICWFFFFSQSCIYGHLSYFWYFTTANNPATNSFVHAPFCMWASISLEEIARNKISRLKDEHNL